MSIATAITAAQQKVENAYTAISNKGGTLPATQDLSNMPTAINSIPTGASPVIQSLNVTPSTSAQTITATGSVDGYSPVNVSAVTAAIDANIVAGNIKQGVTILGVAGSYTGVVPTGTYSITENGTYDITNYASVDVNVSGAGTSYLGLPVSSWAFKVESGKLSIDRSGTPDFAGVTTLDNSVLKNYFTGWTGLTGTAKFDDVETITDTGCFTKMFNNTGITGISFAKLQSISGAEPTPSITPGSSANNGQATFYQTPLVSFSMPLLESITTNYALCNACTGKTTLTSINLGSLRTVSSNYCFYYAFSESNIPAVDLSSLETISGNYAFYRTFYGAKEVTVDMSSLISINGNNACNGMFYNQNVSLNNRLETVDLSSLTTITGDNACNSMFWQQTNLTSNPFTNVKTVTGNWVFTNCFASIPFTELHFDSIETISGSHTLGGFLGISANHSYLHALTFDGLETATGDNVLTGIISGGLSGLSSFRLKSLETITGSNACSKLNENGSGSYTTVNKSWLKHLYFDSLSTADGYRLFEEIAQPYNSSYYLDDLWFYALNSSSFGSTYTNQFYNMLLGHTGTTVHFPIALQSTIGSWSDVTGGFGGTNITVLFDIVTSLTGADSNTYTRYQKGSDGSTYTCWKHNNTVYYTSGTTEPAVSDTIYSDSACTVAVTTVSAIA